MTFSIRSCLTTGVAALTAVTIAAVPSISAPVAHPPTVAAVPQVRVVEQPVRLAAAVAPTAVSSTALPSLLTDWIHNIIPSSTAPFPTPQFPPTVGGNSISSGIKNVYNAVEPWVQWGFEVAAYAVGWVPWVGWLAPQIMIFYNLGERIVRSITFNIADWIGGSVTFLQGLRNVAVDTVNSFIQFANDELAFFLPPLPPIPPIGGSLAAATAEPTTLKPATTADTVTATGKPEKTEVTTHDDGTTPSATETVPTTPTDQPETQPETKADAKTDLSTDAKPDTTTDAVETDAAKADPTETKPDTTTSEPGISDTKKTDAPKTDTTKTDVPSTDTGKTDAKADTGKTDKAGTDKPAPKKAEPKKKKHDRAPAGESAPKADSHPSSDAN